MIENFVHEQRALGGVAARGASGTHVLGTLAGVLRRDKPRRCVAAIRMEVEHGLAVVLENAAAA